MEEKMDIIKICSDKKRIGIGGHIRPDGDCVGSTLALSLYLKNRFPESEINVYLEEPSDIFSCIKDFDKLNHDFPDVEAHDVFFVLDCESERLGLGKKYFEAAKIKVNIDHHITNKGCGDFNYIVHEASSTSELVFDLTESAFMDQEIAKAVYIGIIHDTGVLQYSNTSPKTLRTVAELISFGFDFSEIITKTFYEKTYLQNQIMGRAILESLLIMDGRCIVSSVDKKMLDFYHADSRDLDGIVNQLRITKGVDCAVFMYQIGTMEYKVSMRSDEKVNVAKIAELFGGGGHCRAAGCTINGTFHDVINNLSAQIEKQLKNS